MLLPLVTLLLLADPIPKVAVIDVSAPDAVYEDVSRGLAEGVVDALRAAGLDAVRVDENQLPEQGCRIGPCLGQVARAQKAAVVVILDATEVDKQRTSVSVAAMAGRNGMPLTARRYVAKTGARPPPEVPAFARELARKLLPLADGGTPPKPRAPDAGVAPSR